MVIGAPLTSSSSNIICWAHVAYTSRQVTSAAVAGWAQRFPRGGSARAANLAGVAEPLQNLGHGQADPRGHLVDEAGNEKADSQDVASGDGPGRLTTLVSQFPLFAKSPSPKWRNKAAPTPGLVAAQGCFAAF